MKTTNVSISAVLNKRYTDELSLLRKKYGAATSEIAALKQENVNLSARLSKMDNTHPTAIFFDKLKCTDDEVKASFRLNKAGRLKVVLYRARDNRMKDSVVTDYATRPKIEFKSLKSQEEYHVEAIVIDVNGNERPVKLTRHQDENLRFKTSADINNPQIAPIKQAITSSSITIPISTTSGQRIAAEAVCQKRIVQDGLSTMIEVYRKSIDRDELGYPSSAATNAVIKVENLEAQTNYELTVVVYNEHNKSTTLPLTYWTEKAIPELQFSGGIEFDFNKLQTRIAWKPNVPTTTAKVQITNVKDPGSVFFEARAEQKNDSLVALLNYDEIAAIVSRAETRLNPPAIKVIMGDGKKTVEAVFRIKFSVPSKEQIDKSSLSADKKRRLKEATDATASAAREGNGRIKWDKIVEIGLPLVLSVL